MTAPLTKTQLAPVMPTTVTYRDTAVETTQGFSLPRAIANAVRYVVSFPRRQAVLNELSRLTDRELADIGLHRGDLHAVFARA